MTRNLTLFWRKLRALDDHWVGDLIGALCLGVMLWGGLLVGAVLQ